ncbi:MAG: prolipoprotein diacylglyceryl transferase, partial [Acidimicrobiia bacterium]|nr:prolipoprotein diacylglyceryl transferase [Acidimicrobiia bacterium]
IGALWLTLWWEGPRGNAVECDRDVFEMAMTAAIAGLAIGRVWAMVANGTNPLTNPADLLIVRSGVATGPAALGAIGVYAWLARRNLWWLIDGVAAAALAGLAGWHAGCLTRDACLGTATDLPWAMQQPGSTVGRHPVELYAAIGLALAAGAIAWLKTTTRRPAPGALAGAALAIAAAIQLATEPLRPGLGTGPVWWYVVGIVTGLAVVLARRKRHRDAG